MNNFLLPVVLVLLPGLVAAQQLTEAERVAQSIQNLSTVSGRRPEMATYTTNGVGLAGSPMLFPNWRTGELLLIGNQRATPVPLKYDLYRQELRVRRPQGDSVLLPMSQVREFRLLEPMRYFVNYSPSPPDVAGPCAEVLVNGKNVQLVKYMRKKIIKPSAAGDSYTAYTAGAWLEEVQYFLRWPSDGRFSPLHLKRASLEYALAAYAPALATLKSRKGSLNSEADFVHAVADLEPLLAAPSH